MPNSSFPYIPGHPRPHLLPLARFLPPLPERVASTWLTQQNLPPGSWILDPFGAAPEIPVEIAHAGMRVLVAANNPVIAFMIEVLCQSPDPTEFQAAISDLSIVRKGDERLGAHISALYLVRCQGCNVETPARAFIWEEDAVFPDTCLVECPTCGFNGEQPVSPEALERLKAIPSGGLHLARALERVAAPGDPIRPNVELALGAYLNRPLYVLTTLINKVEGMTINPSRRLLLKALLLTLCDDANTLWSYPVTRNRPRQLTRPHRFRENNLWVALENAVSGWSTQQPALPVTRFPELPPESGGVCLFAGRIKELAPLLANIHPQAILTVLPRSNQAFWTLSAVWSGWLFGREAASGFHTALARQRYDWQWYTSALHASLAVCKDLLFPDTPFFALLPEVEPAFLSSVFTASVLAGLTMEGMAFRADEGLAQLHWQTHDPVVKPIRRSANPTELIHGAITSYMAARAEPCSYITLQAVILSALTRQDLLVDPATPPPQALTLVQKLLQDTFADRMLLNRNTDRQLTPEKSLWRTASFRPQALTLSDRVEMAIINHVQRTTLTNTTELDNLLCHEFPGLLTPDTGLILACLDSYTELVEGQPAMRNLRPNEATSIRRTDLQAIQSALARLGERMNFEVTGVTPLVWQTPSGESECIFYIIGSAIVSQHVINSRYPADRCFLVMPGSRVGLFSYKRRSNPYLAELLTQGWRVLKYRQVRRLDELPTISRSALDDLLNSDPLEEVLTQMPFFTSREEY